MRGWEKSQPLATSPSLDGSTVTDGLPPGPKSVAAVDYEDPAKDS